MRNVIRALALSFAAAALAVASTAVADPIGDSMVSNPKVGWYPSIAQPCSQVCKLAFAAAAEREGFAVAALPNRVTHDCKAKTTTPAPMAGAGWLYGNNFDSPNYAPFCIVSTPEMKVQRHRVFHCLCAL